MAIFWILSIVIQLVVAVGVVALLMVLIRYSLRHKSGRDRLIGVCLPPIVLCILLLNWFEPHELTRPKELADRFEEVFPFAPNNDVSDIHYQWGDGPDDKVEWFRFNADESVLQRLSEDLKPIDESEFAEQSSKGPRWWLSNAKGKIAYYHGSIKGRARQSPASTSAWIAYDQTTRTVYCFIHSLI